MDVFNAKTKGYIFANLFGITAIALSRFLLNDSDGGFIFSEFVIVPMLMGIISAWFWRELDLTGKQLTAASVINTCVAIAGSAIFLGEGSICLVIVSPLLFAFLTAGAFAGRSMFRKNDQTLNVSIVSLLLIIFVTDSLSRHFYENEVSDQVVINAPVNKVWPLVVAYDRIKEPADYWLFRIGMPSPIQSTVNAYRLGASRKCIFSNGYTFDERIVTYDVNRNLTFDITNQPRDPEIMGHIDILRGQFILKDNGNGTTTLTGNSWYKLYVFPAWYYDWWAQSITRNVHLRVMKHIKQLCERK